MKPGCGTKCRFKCHSKFDQDASEKLFHNYWRLGDINRQRDSINTHVKMSEKDRRTKGNAASRKAATYQWYFEDHDLTQQRGYASCSFSTHWTQMTVLLEQQSRKRELKAMPIVMGEENILKDQPRKTKRISEST